MTSNYTSADCHFNEDIITPFLFWKVAGELFSADSIHKIDTGYGDL